MTEIAQIFLGNIHQKSELASLIKTQSYLTALLSGSERHKSRILAQISEQLVVGIIKSRDRPLCSGDLFQTDSGQLLLIQLQEPALMELDLTQLAPETTPEHLVKLGHLLGNHHYPIVLQQQKIYVQLTTDKAVLEQLLFDLKLDGLQISYQLPQPTQNLLFTKPSHHHP